MSKQWLTGLMIAFLGLGVAWAGNSDKKQQQLDAACEAAREQKLAPERERYIEECVTKKQRPDRAACERFYADYGNQAGGRAPLYMDLPECVKAFEYGRGKR